MNIRSREELKTIYSLNEEQFVVIEQLEFYKRALQQSLIEWNSPLSTPQRIRLISQAYTENNLPIVAGRAAQPKEPLPAVVEVMRYLARLGGLDEAKVATALNPTERFVIQINMGSGEAVTYDKPITIEVEKNPEPALEAPTTTESKAQP